MNRALQFSLPVTLLLLLTLCLKVHSDGIRIDKVYDPYVQRYEKEIEWRSAFFNLDEDSGDTSYHRLGIGYGLADRWFAEVYFVGEKAADESLSLSAMEVEAKWQLTEQGEYPIDVGLLFELEDKHNSDIFEAVVALLVAKDFSDWTALANFGLAYEWGNNIDQELESTFSAQLRYRYQPYFEPGMEFYLAQDNAAFGPMASGVMRLWAGDKLLWNVAVILGLDDESPDSTYKFALEYEF